MLNNKTKSKLLLVTDSLPPYLPTNGSLNLSKNLSECMFTSELTKQKTPPNEDMVIFGCFSAGSNSLGMVDFLNEV